MNGSRTEMLTGQVRCPVCLSWVDPVTLGLYESPPDIPVAIGRVKVCKGCRHGFHLLSVLKGGAEP